MLVSRPSVLVVPPESNRILSLYREIASAIVKTELMDSRLSSMS